MTAVSNVVLALMYVLHQYRCWDTSRPENQFLQEKVRNMEEKTLIKSGEILISHPPHIWKGFSTPNIMYIVLAVLFLPAGAAVYFFGLHALWIIISSTVTAILVEFVIRKLRKNRWCDTYFFLSLGYDCFLLYLHIANRELQTY